MLVMMVVTPQPPERGGKMENSISRQVTARAENDAAAVVAALALGLFSTLVTLVVFAKVLSNMPGMVAAGVIFSLVVFAIVCVVAFLGTERKTVRQGPPQLEFRNPARRRRQKAKVAR